MAPVGPAWQCPGPWRVQPGTRCISRFSPTGRLLTRGERQQVEGREVGNTWPWTDVGFEGWRPSSRRPIHSATDMATHHNPTAGGDAKDIR